MTKSREWLLYNAVEAWLVNYQSSAHIDTVNQYKELRAEFHDVYTATQAKDAPIEEVVDAAPTVTRTRRTTKTKA